MTMYELRCKDAGFDCAAVVTAPTKEDVLKQAAAHAREVHKTEVTPEMAKTISGLIRQTSP
jgi:predicted small metal-binding protein